MSTRYSFFLILIIMALDPLFAAANTKLDFVEFDLENGLHVILHKDNSNPLVSVHVWYHVGSKDEDSNRTGFAHLFEHMMFQGSENISKAEHFKYIQEAGGILNGSTNQDRTNYFETVPSNQLELALWLESDRMRSLSITHENFDNQREVVKEEKRQRYDNVPYGTRFYNLFSRAFEGHPYSWIPIGSTDNLDDADLDYAKSFYGRFYAPNNAVLVIAGDINYDETIETVTKYFGELDSAPPKAGNYPETEFEMGEKSDTIYDNIKLPAIYIGYKVPGLTADDIYALNLLSQILSDGASSRLYQDIVYKNKSAKSINSFVWDLELGGLFVISSVGLPNSDLKLIDEQIIGQIELIKSDGVSSVELQKAKNHLESRLTDRSQTMRGIANRLAYYWMYFKNTKMVNNELETYLRVTEEDIKKVCIKYLKKNNRTVLFYLPAVR